MKNENYAIVTQSNEFSEFYQYKIMYNILFLTALYSNKNYILYVMVMKYGINKATMNKNKRNGQDSLTR